MKKIATLTICAVMALSAAALTGCGDSTDSSKASSSKSAAEEEPKDINTVSDKLLNEITYKDQLTELSEDKIEGVVGVSKDLFKSAKVYRGSGATAEEIDCFEAVDTTSADLIYEILGGYIKDQKARYLDYAPAEMDKLEKAVLVEDGNLVFLSVSDDDAKAKEIIG